MRYVDKIQDLDNSRTMYTLETKDITFSLYKAGEQNICHFNVARTEHPKLFILENARENTFIPKSGINPANIDCFSYINSKFLYFEKYLQGQISKMYFSILKNRCKLETKVLTNALSIATIMPEEFGFKLLQETGYHAVVTGEVIHLLKCLRVEVHERVTKLALMNYLYIESRQRRIFFNATHTHFGKNLNTHTLR